MLILILLALLPACLLTLWLYSSPFYWKRKDVPSLLPLPVFGNLVPSFRMSLAQFYDKLYYTFPNENLCGFHLLMKPVLLVRDPDLIKDVFIKDFEYFSANGYTANYERDPFSRSLLLIHGEEWKEIRGKFSKYFTPSKLRNTMQDYVELSMKKMNNAIQDRFVNNKPVKIDKLLEKLSTDIIIQAVLGVETDSFTKNSYFNKIGGKLFCSLTNFKLYFGLISPQLFPKLNFDILDNEVTEFLKKILIDVMDERKKKNFSKNDLLSDMMKLMEENRLANSNGNKTIEYNFKTIFSQLLTLILGGVESTALIMSFLLYELSINQEIQEKCRQEILDVINETGTDIRQEDVRRLTYLEMAINESTRKYPPFIAVPRCCTKRCKLRGTNIVIDPGTVLLIPARSIQWDPKYFPEPEKFLPERFSEENNGKMDQGINLSWGIGPRTCLGMSFAKLEMQLVLSRLLSKYRFTLSSRTSNPLKMVKYMLIAKPDPAIWLNVEPIK